MQVVTENTQPNDRWIFSFVYPLMIFGMVHIGNDNSIGTLLKLPSYYSDLLLATLAIYGTGGYLRHLCFKLDQRYDWQEQFRIRIRHQLQYGILLPLLVLMGIEILYLVLILKIPLAGHPIAYLELPLAFLFLLLLNLIYFLLYFRKHQLALARLMNVPAIPDQFIVNSGAKAIPVPVEEVAYFIKLERTTFLLTSGGEQYVYDLPLERIIDQLDQQRFFQLNRQLIAHRNSILSYTATATRKLYIELEPSPARTIYVSKARVGDFTRWLASA
ncbi:MAG: LytTR family transcriptional regulator DNA-binding domain-containing protein [Saprospiraceae bacterium]